MGWDYGGCCRGEGHRYLPTPQLHRPTRGVVRRTPEGPGGEMLEGLEGANGDRWAEGRLCEGRAVCFREGEEGAERPYGARVGRETSGRLWSWAEVLRDESREMCVLS